MLNDQKFKLEEKVAINQVLKSLRNKGNKFSL